MRESKEASDGAACLRESVRSFNACSVHKSSRLSQVKSTKHHSQTRLGTFHLCKSVCSFIAFLLSLPSSKRQQTDPGLRSMANLENLSSTLTNPFCHIDFGSQPSELTQEVYLCCIVTRQQRPSNFGNT